MSQTYTIKPGDTLLQIAVDQQVEFTELLVLNPQYQSNPDFIRAGDVLVLPEVLQTPSIKPDYSIEPPELSREISEKGGICSDPECKPMEVCDVLFVTGDQPTEYYCLDKTSQSLLLEEMTFTEQLIQNYKEVLDSAPSDDNLTQQALQEHALKKKAWLENAVYAGAIKVEKNTPTAGVAAEANPQKPTQHYIESKITELNKRKRMVSTYASYFSEPSTRQLQKQVIERIEAEVKSLSTLLDKPPIPESSHKQQVDLNNFQEGTFKRPPPRRHIVEVWVASQNKLVYLRADFFEREKKRWIQNPEKTAVTKALAKRDWQGLKNALLEDIKKGINEDIQAAKLEAIFKHWQADGWKVHEWKATQQLFDDEGEVLMAVTEEAQLLRFAAQASVKAELSPKKGKVDLGFKADASFALAEGAVSLTRYFPYESGYSVVLSYTDANKQPAEYPFGCFRAKLNLLLSCFVGAMVNGQFNITNTPSKHAGHQVLLAPSVGLGTTPSSGVGVKADIFGGAQVGGQIEGGLEWQAPPDLEQGKTFIFETLAKVAASGNVALGAGASWDFQLSFYDGKFHFNCSGRLVFGPGASGGFGTEINVEQLWNLALVIFKGLRVIDYRILSNIDDIAYKHIMHSSYAAFVAEFIESPHEALKKALTQTQQSIESWWAKRVTEWENDSKRKQEAERLAERIVSSIQPQGCLVTGEVAFDELFPETIGIMLNTLVTTFYFSFEEKQETAIYILLLGTVRTWRRFEEILSRMNVTGKKQSGDKAMFDNLARINAILDGEQQDSFNRWVLTLAQDDKITANNFAQMTPFPPRQGKAFQDKYPLIETQIAQLNNSNGEFYV